MMTISLEQTAAGDWNVCLCQQALFRALQLGPAIRMARAVARDEHHRLGRGVRVQMPGPTSDIVLACYPETSLPLLAGATGA
jgi:hypothetical protein